MEKTAKYAEEQDNDSTYSFQNYDSRQLLMFFYQGWYLHKEKETLFLTSFMANFGLTATSLFEIWTPAWSSDSTSRFHIGIFILFLTEWSSLACSFFCCCCFFVLFCFVFFTKDFVPLLIFHEQRFFHEQRASICQFCRVRDLNKIWKQHENRPPTAAVAAKISPGDSPRSEIITPYWFINFYLKIRFFK